MRTLRVVHDLTVPDDFTDQTMARVAAENALSLKAAAQKTYLRGTPREQAVVVNHHGFKEVKQPPAAQPPRASSPPSSP